MNKSYPEIIALIADDDDLIGNKVESDEQP